MRNGMTMPEVWLGGDPAESARQRSAAGTFEGEISYQRIHGWEGKQISCLLTADGETLSRAELLMVGVPIHKTIADPMPADHELAVWLPARWLGRAGTGGIVVRAIRAPFSLGAVVEMGARWMPPAPTDGRRAKSETPADPRARAQGDLIDRRHRGMNPARMARLTEAARLLHQGYSAPYVAREMGVHEDTVNDWRRELRSMQEVAAIAEG